MRILLIALLLASFVSAFSIRPDFLGIKDSGSESLDSIEVGITIDCDTKSLTVDVKENESGDAVGDAQLYLFYTQYEYQLIATGTTGSNGTGTINVVGTRDYLTRLFILRVDKPGLRSREIEFGYKKCFESPPEEPAEETPPADETPPANQTQQNQTPPANVTPPANATPPEPPQGNATQPAGNESGAPGPAAGPCPAALALMALFMARARA